MDSDSQTSSIIFQLLIIVLLTLVNAYFAASEMAIVSVNKTKLKNLSQSGNKKAALVENLIDEPTAFLSTIQVAITLAGFFNSASAATGISKLLGNALEQLSVPYAQTIAMIVITVLLSFITLIFGELVPKRMALQNAEKFSMFCARPILVISKLLSPFIKILSVSTKIILRLFGMKDDNVEESLSREEIRSVVNSGRENGVFNETETEMINNLFEFDDIEADEIMTPRTDVFCIDVNSPAEKYIDELMKMHYSRIPVYEDTVDNIIGILNIKDFVIEAYNHNYNYNDVNIRKILRKPYFVLETHKIDKLFKEMQKTHQHIALLLDEYGGFSGIVTMEDLVEEITGDIADEYDKIDTPDIIKIDDTHYLLDGLAPLDELEDKFSLNVENDDYDTISGFLLDKLGRVLDDGETAKVTYKNFDFDILKVEDKHIEKVKLSINPIKTDENQDEEQNQDKTQN